MSKMELLQTYSMQYNESGITNQEKYPDLVSGVFTMLIAVDNQSYTAVVRFNYAEEYPFISIYDKSGALLQGETYLAEAPVNLLTCDALFNYALVWVKKLKRFELWSINNSKWYNSPNLTPDEAYQVLITKTFNALNE